MNTEILLPHPETNPETVSRKIRKNLPWILGAATVVAGTFFIRAWASRSKTQEHEETEKQGNTPAGISGKSFVVQLLPLAMLFLKNWLKKTEPGKEVATP